MKTFPQSLGCLTFQEQCCEGNMTRGPGSSGVTEGGMLRGGGSMVCCAPGQHRSDQLPASSASEKKVEEAGSQSAAPRIAARGGADSPAPLLIPTLEEAE